MLEEQSGKPEREENLKIDKTASRIPGSVGRVGLAAPRGFEKQEQRTARDPSTPRVAEQCSKRAFDGRLKQ